MPHRSYAVCKIRRLLMRIQFFYRVVFEWKKDYDDRRDRRFAIRVIDVRLRNCSWNGVFLFLKFNTRVVPKI